MVQKKYTVDEIDQQINQLREQRKDALRREKKEDGELKAQAITEFGRLVLERFGVAWRRADLLAIADAFDAHPELFPEREEAPLKKAREEVAALKKRRVAKPAETAPAQEHGNDGYGKGDQNND